MTLESSWPDASGARAVGRLATLPTSRSLPSSGNSWVPSGSSRATTVGGVRSSRGISRKALSSGACPAARSPTDRSPVPGMIPYAVPSLRVRRRISPFWRAGSRIAFSGGSHPRAARSSPPHRPLPSRPGTQKRSSPRLRGSDRAMEGQSTGSADSRAGALAPEERPRGCRQADVRRSLAPGRRAAGSPATRAVTGGSGHDP